MGLRRPGVYVCVLPACGRRLRVEHYASRLACPLCGAPVEMDEQASIRAGLRVVTPCPEDRRPCS